MSVEDVQTTPEAVPEPVEAPREHPHAAPGKSLSPAARRALEEAAARKAELDERARALAAEPEFDGRGGLEPVRYNDWEVKGIASDF